MPRTCSWAHNKNCHTNTQLPLCFDPFHALAQLLRVGPKTFNPVHIRLAAEPCHLPLGIVSVSLLSRSNGLRQCERAFEILHGLPIAERVERPRRVAVTLLQAASFFDKAAGEHLLCARVEALIERF